MENYIAKLEEEKVIWMFEPINLNGNFNEDVNENINVSVLITLMTLKISSSSLVLNHLDG